MGGLNRLPDELLLQIITHTSLRDRLGDISLVNKRFHAVCSRPSSIWTDLELRIGWVNDPTASSLGLLRFLQRRLPVLCRLSIKGSLSRPLHVTRVPWQGDSLALCSYLPLLAACGMLRALSLSDLELKAEHVGCLGLLAGLTQLRLSKVAAPHALPELYKSLAALPGLQSLDVGFSGSAEAGPDHGARHGFPNVLLGLTRLTCLGWGCAVSTAVFDFVALPEALGQRLTQLRGLGFVNCGVRALPASMTQLSRLRALRVVGDRKYVSNPPPLTQLSIPGLPASLCRVHVSSVTLPTALQQLPGLTYLAWDLPTRRTDFLTLSTLVALRQLRVSNYTGATDLAAVMDGLQLPPALHTLALVDCLLKRLPQLPAACLQRLRHLNLASNKLAAVPPEAVLLTACTALELSHNPLDQLGASLARLGGLRALDCLGLRKALEERQSSRGFSFGSERSWSSLWDGADVAAVLHLQRILGSSGGKMPAILTDRAEHCAEFDAEADMVCSWAHASS